MSKPRTREQDPALQEVLPGASAELLKALHLLTRDGALNADARRKLKQVAHLLNLLRPALEDIFERYKEPIAVDCGAGKAYLGLILAETMLKPKGRGSMLGIETRADLVATAQRIADGSKLVGVRMIQSTLDTALIPERAHLVTALHACDTATDDAMALALAAKADHIALVPCCQAEVARQLGQSKKEGVIGLLGAHALHRREFGSHLTNVFRSLVLEAHGYQVTVTELTGWEHSLKNELILARKVHRENRSAAEKLRQLIQETGVRPKILDLLGGEKRGFFAGKTVDA